VHGARFLSTFFFPGLDQYLLRAAGLRRIPRFVDKLGEAVLLALGIALRHKWRQEGTDWKERRREPRTEHERR